MSTIYQSVFQFKHVYSDSEVVVQTLINQLTPTVAIWVQL